MRLGFLLAMTFVLFAGVCHRTGISHRLSSRGFFDRYDRKGEQMFDRLIRSGSCINFTPSFTKPISSDWISTPDWTYQNNRVVYSGGGSSRDKHFWLWFWKRDRWWNRYALIQKNFWCKKAEVRAEVTLTGADEAGLFFRARGTWDFWALLLGATRIKLVRFREGERFTLKDVKHTPVGQSTVLVLSDQIGDVEMWYGPDWNSTTKMSYPQGGMNEIEDSHQGAAGLISFGAGAKFGNVVVGNVRWNPDDGAPKKLHKQIAELSKPSVSDPQSSPLGKLMDLSDELTRWCPSPSYCSSRAYFNLRHFK